MSRLVMSPLDSRRVWEKLTSRDQASRKVQHDQTYPGVLILKAIAENA